jgi:hypothetical protein
VIVVLKSLINSSPKKVEQVKFWLGGMEERKNVFLNKKCPFSFSFGKEAKNGYVSGQQKMK